jgi:methylenetetrahydrofolate dehydrogenase (NADP+)/methenyltetrahydrofolate cyclohydrolase
MKLLNGKEIAGFVKERQAKEVRRLKQSERVNPALLILKTIETPATKTYMRIKERYGSEIGVRVEVVDCVSESDLKTKILKANANNDLQGVIVQLPLGLNIDMGVLNEISPGKDIDSLGAKSNFRAPTPTAIDWLLAGYDISLAGKKILVLGEGKLVGGPLVELWRAQGYDPVVISKPGDDIEKAVRGADLIVSGIGAAGVIKSSWIKSSAIVIDAGTSTDSQGLSGDVERIARDRDDISITPVIGGVGPLTVAVLFDNLLLAAASSKK